MTSRRFRCAALALTSTVVVACALSASTALAASNVGWEVMSNSFPAHLPPGDKGTVEIALFNVGAGVPQGQVRVTDVLPQGLTAVAAGELEVSGDADHIGIGRQIRTSAGGGEWECAGIGTNVVTCTAEPGTTASHVAEGGAGAGYPMYVGIEVSIEQGAKEGADPNAVTVVGGGAATPAGTTHPLIVSSQPASFGFTNWDAWFSNENGTIDTQAGSHPYAATFGFDLATARERHDSLFETESEAEWLLEGTGELSEGSIGGDVNSIEAALPPGLVGDPHAVPQCTHAELITEQCPQASQIGIISILDQAGSDFAFEVYNMVPPAGAPAEFGFDYEGIPTFMQSAVRSGSDYGIDTVINNVAQRRIEESYLTLWGYPADPSHDDWRNPNPGGCDSVYPHSCAPESVAGVVPKPLLTLPTSCTGPARFTIRADTWQNPAVKGEYSVLSHNAAGTPQGFTGCGQLGFSPSITLAPDTADADTPAGLTVELKPPVGGLSELEGLSTADLQDTKVVLPAGVAINPGQAAGLISCSRAQDGLESLPNGEEDRGPASCPAASKVGTVTIETPLLSKRMEGNVYVLPSNPPHLELLLAASAEGVNLKLIGHVELNEQTGQLTTMFEGTPALPFTNFNLSFSGGAQAALATPTHCGVYASAADFTPWSSPFDADALEESDFALTSGTGGAACPASGALPYTPQMIAGSTTDQAGGYTAFSLLLQVPDDQQRTERLQFKTPEGLLGMIAKVPLCSNAQAESDSCPAVSQIGHTVVQSGPGPYPLVIPEPGQPPAPIYLTEGYEGAPYGLSIVVPIHAGPFTLPTQRVRAKIEVDELTSQLTITTSPLPQYVAGVPTDLRTINAVIDRPGFMFNPTGCEAQAFSGIAYGTEGAQAPISSHFQMGSCRALLFKPNFKASTPGKTSRANGAGLNVKLVYPTGELGANQASSQSNIKSIRVELPKKLPSRLTTLQKACTAAQFNANPAGCPAASVVGHAKAVTPVLPVPLEGPAYFVSNGNEAFPNLIVVLQGYGVTIHLVGDTFISNKGITSSTFKSVPDVPIASFELNLPEGPYSALAANGNLCKAKLSMPTHFLAQNGAELNQNTALAVTGCPRAKQAKHESRSKTKGRHGNRRKAASKRSGKGKA
jgi:uncharacterized repeat protein (TIGR01451 family)